jgi:hypothetical protein
VFRNQKKKIEDQMIAREHDSNQIKPLFFHIHMLPCMMSAEPSCSAAISAHHPCRKKKKRRVFARDGKARLAMMDFRFGIHSLPTKGASIQRPSVS